MSAFLRRYVNKVFAKVTGERVNRAGNVIPCMYRLYGLRAYIISRQVYSLDICDAANYFGAWHDGVWYLWSF